MAGTESREIIMSEEQEALLKTVLQLDARRKIPQEALDMYQEIRVSLGRLGQHTMTREMLALVPVFLNRVARPEPQTFFDEVKEHGDVKYGTRVIAKWRNKWRAGRFLRMEDGKVVVVIDDDTAEERKIGPTNVRRAMKEDLDKLGERDDS